MAHQLKWKPIEDLPPNHAELGESGLRSLLEVWKEQKASIEQEQAVREFNERLQRSWAIETGLIERVYTLDRGITQLLVEKGLEESLIPHSATDKSPQAVIQIIRDQKNAIEGLFDFVASRRQLSTSYIKELHATLTASQETTEAVDQFGKRMEVTLRRGEYKIHPNNPRRPNGTIHEYCPPEQVASEMDRLVELHFAHQGEVFPEVEAAWLHHRFTQIHPFQDGNGRVARALATLVFLREKWLPLVISDTRRGEYIGSLEKADLGDLGPLVKFFARIEEKSFLKALSVATEVQQREKQVRHAIDALKEKFRADRKALQAKWEGAKEKAGRLHSNTDAYLQVVAGELDREVGPFADPGSDFKFYVTSDPPGGSRSHWFRSQVIETARQLDYFANLDHLHAWSRLVAEMRTRCEVLVSFHGIGHRFRGIIAASACFYRRDVTEENETELSETIPLCDELFQINYKEPYAELEGRFEKWLSEVVVKGLEMARRSG